MPAPPRLWNGVLERLAKEMPRYVFEAWLQPLQVVEEPGALVLQCPSPFHRDRVRSRFLEAITQQVDTASGGGIAVRLTIVDPKQKPPQPKHEVEAERRPDLRPNGSPQSPKPAVQGPGTDSFESFVVGPCNALAREASLAVAQGRQLAMSPLFLVSPSGLGKTHLARAIVREVRRRGKERVIYVSAETFTSEFTASIRARSTAGFKQRYRRECDLLVVEDVQFFDGKASTQLEIFHTLEHLQAVGRRIVLTADRLPREIGRLDPRLRSQMTSGLVAEMEDPDASLRRQILRTKASHGGVRIPPECLDLLVERVRGSVRDLEGVLTQIVASATLLKRRIDLQLTQEALRKVETGAERALNPESVVRVVATFFQTTPEAMASRSRRRDVLRPRQLAMALCRRYTDASLEQIGRALGREHPAVRNAIDSIERSILESAPLRYQAEAIAARLDALAGSPQRREHTLAR